MTKNERDIDKATYSLKVLTLMIKEKNGEMTPDQCAKKMGFSLEGWEEQKDLASNHIQSWEDVYTCELCDNQFKDLGGLGFVIPDDPKEPLHCVGRHGGMRHLCARCLTTAGAVIKAFLTSPRLAAHFAYSIDGIIVPDEDQDHGS